MTSWWLFPPKTREVQFDDKWAFVGKKEKNRGPDDPEDNPCGDHGDHVAVDAEHRLVVSVMPGERTAENVQALVQDFKRRTGGRKMNLITTDEYVAYKAAIREAYGQAGASSGPVQGSTARTELCDGPQDPGKRPGGEDRLSGGVRDGGHGVGGVSGIDRQPSHQHRVRGEAQRHGPQP
jgi:hypothetical protein